MDEKKTYEIKGTVTIGTDEYRDLIEDVANYKQAYEQERRDRWSAQSERDKVKKELEAAKEEIELLKQKITKYKVFVEKNEEIRREFTLYCAALLQVDENA